MRRLVLTTLLAAALALPSALRGQAFPPPPPPPPPAGDSLRLAVDGMVCSLCAYGVERRLKKLKQVERVNVDLDSGLVVVVLEPGAAVSDSALAAEVRKAGFALRGVSRFDRARKGSDER